jgi:ribosomal protein S18 acetylase RimI-like enzyme
MLTDKKLFAKLWLTPYLNTEPENAVVVDDSGEVKGYLVAGFRPDFKRRAFWAVLPWAVVLGLKYALGFYAKAPGMRQWARWILLHSWREVPKHPYGSPHFHFNLDADVRGSLRLGDQLVAEFERRVRKRGGDSWHTIVFSSPSKRSPAFYERLGFEIYASSPCSLYGDETKYLTIVKHMHSEAESVGATRPQKRRMVERDDAQLRA